MRDEHNVPDLMARLNEAQIRVRIQQARNVAGLTQPEMADLLGISKRGYENYEANQGAAARVPYSRLGDIAEITGTSLRWLLHGDADDEIVAFVKKLDQRLSDMNGRLEKLLERVPGHEGPVEPATAEALLDELKTATRAAEALLGRIGETASRRSLQSRRAKDRSQGSPGVAA